MPVPTPRSPTRRLGRPTAGSAAVFVRSARSTRPWPDDLTTGVSLMQTAFRLEATVLPGHRLEITAPELPEGATVEVIVVLPSQPQPPRVSMLDFLATLPPGPLLFKTPEEANRYLQEERDSWER